METGLTRQFSATAVITPASTHLLLSTGRVPGMAQSNSATAVLGGESNEVVATEKSLLAELICACTSRPIALCQRDLNNSD